MADQSNDAPIYSAFFGVMGAASAIIFSGEYLLNAFIASRSRDQKIFIIEIEEKWSGTQVSFRTYVYWNMNVGCAQTSIVRFFEEKNANFCDTLCGDEIVCVSSFTRKNCTKKRNIDFWAKD